MMMMMMKNADRKQEDKKKRGPPRRQKRPHGNAIRRRAPKRRRTVLQRRAEKNVLNPDRRFGYKRQAALNKEVRKAFAMRPVNADHIGLSGKELAHVELMMRSDGGWGMAMVMSSALQCLATMDPHPPFFLAERALYWVAVKELKLGGGGYS